MKKIIILVAAVLIFGLGTATKADAWCSDFDRWQSNGWPCLEATLTCGMTAQNGSAKFVTLSIDNYSCDTAANFQGIQHAVMGNAGASLATGGTAGGDFRVWGPFRKATGASNVPMATVCGTTPGNYTTLIKVVDPMPTELQGTWADILVDVIDSNGQWVDADGDCTVFVQ